MTFQTGYREGITQGKESSLQEGFDSGFANVGSPIGREIGILRGIISALMASLNGASPSIAVNERELLLDEARYIASQLSKVRFSEIAPRDLEAEAHAREHLEMNGDDAEMDENEELVQKRQMEGLEDMLDRLTAETNAARSEQPKLTMDDVQNLKTRILSLCAKLGLVVDWS